MIRFGSQNNRKHLRTFSNGLLYTNNTVTVYNFAPEGWHLPSYSEWLTLIDYCGGELYAGAKLKSTRTGYVAGVPNWSSPNTGANNLSRFTALPAGFRATDGTFYSLHNHTYWWTATPDPTDGYYQYFLQLIYNERKANFASSWRNNGMSVRFIKDYVNGWYPGMVIKDVDDNEYHTLKIGEQVWLGSNWKCTKFNDRTSIPHVPATEDWDSLTLNYAYCSYNNADILEFNDLF